MTQQDVKKAFMYPPRSQNEFLELNKNALNKIGYDVQPTDLAFVKYMLASPRKAVVILNWVEDRVYGRSYKTAIQYFFKMIALVVFSKFFAKKVVWIKHNFKPHNSSGSTKRFTFLCRLFGLLGIPPVSLESYFKSPSLVHPLYKSDEKLVKHMQCGESQATNDVLFFGGIKPYKNLHLVLNEWPVSLPLKIAGKCSDPVYKEELESIISKRGLKVAWDNRFLSGEELNELLEASKFVLLPHSDGTMISSGSFYHAIGEGCNILTNESEFGREKSKHHSFVHLIDIKGISERTLKEIYVPKYKVLKEVLSHYGEDKVVDAWKVILAGA
ncbi:glycosyltransferase family protein [Alteromonas macleodii]|uniref:hypothetical protein n=1 Tax=Alteromonas macleodii TaxID=28108 RepID=UPI000C77D305|nr:hypothetical protein [Alteromonas macleodii]AUI82186.1 hypothetical protein TE101_07750 [Alteromonas macleodii]MEE3029075.1 hypothetical protein [Pseudomonadota bacterium]|tara:strand:- start:351 stop:1334 length:984 start_codon:yes stop_codon:yes gene_type:complete